MLGVLPKEGRRFVGSANQRLSWAVYCTALEYGLGTSSHAFRDLYARRVSRVKSPRKIRPGLRKHLCALSIRPSRGPTAFSRPCAGIVLGRNDGDRNFGHLGHIGEVAGAFGLAAAQCLPVRQDAAFREAISSRTSRVSCQPAACRAGEMNFVQISRSDKPRLVIPIICPLPRLPMDR